MVVLFIGIMMAASPAPDLSRLLPVEINGWKPQGQDA